MAVANRLIRTAPEAVWAVLADGTRYAEWVAGTSTSHPVRGRWPEVHSAIRYTVRAGPLELANETVVRLCDPGRELELEAHAGPFGTARIAIQVRPWGDHTLVIVDEHPLRGMGGALHNVAAEVAIQWRHRTMLKRLAHVCEESAHSRSVPRGAAGPEAVGADA